MASNDFVSLDANHMPTASVVGGMPKFQNEKKVVAVADRGRDSRRPSLDWFQPPSTRSARMLPLIIDSRDRRERIALELVSLRPVTDHD